jgi:hypothetical protein
MPVCAQHGEQGFHAFACRDVCAAVATNGPALDVTWWECGLDGQVVFASLVCAGCIAAYRLPPSPASLDGPGLPEDVPHQLLAIPVCMRCFEEWRVPRGVSVVGNYPGIPAGWKSSPDAEPDSALDRGGI